MIPDMPVKVRLCNKRFIAVRALVRAIASMGSKHRNAKMNSGKLHVTIPDMRVKVRLCMKRFIAVRALKWALACMDAVMILTTRVTCKRLIAIIAHKSVHLKHYSKTCNKIRVSY